MIKRSDISDLEKETRSQRLHDRRMNLLLTCFDQVKEVVGLISEKDVMLAENVRVVVQTGTREAFEKEGKKPIDVNSLRK